MKKERWNRLLAASALLAFSLAFQSCFAPGGKLTEDSKTDACAQELIGALGSFQRDLGMGYNIASADAQTIFATGEIQKTYGLAGYRYTTYFGLKATGSGCNLETYKQSKSGPGESSTMKLSYSVSLSQCRCQ